MASRAGWGKALARGLPGRDLSFFLWPPKHGHMGARRFAEGAFNTMPEGSVILGDWTPAQPLRYLKEVEGVRPDVTVALLGAGHGQQAPFLEREARERPVFLAAVDRYYDMEQIRRLFDVLPTGPVYLLWRRAE
jgi:hypothetical protein